MNAPLSLATTAMPIGSGSLLRATSGDFTVERQHTTERALELSRDGQAFAGVAIALTAEPRLTFTWNADCSVDMQIAAVIAGVEAVFSENPDIDDVTIAFPAGSISLRDLPFLHAREGLNTGAGEAAANRSGFYQTPLAWLGHQQTGRNLAGLVPGPDGRDHPRRAPEPTGICYQRYDPVAELTVSFRAVDIDRDLDTFHRWMNDGRIAYFWELAQSKDKLRAYLTQLQAKPHTYPLIGCFNGEDAGYFETYWVREDRLGPFYDSQSWDRGWHGLIGERRHLGRNKTGAWLRGLAHYLFLDCPMTENIMGEPRVDNAKLLAYANALAYEKVKEFDFPHKRSALMRCPRDRFFKEVRL